MPLRFPFLHSSLLSYFCAITEKVVPGNKEKNSRPRSFLVPRAFHAHIFLRRCSYQVGDVLLRCNIAAGGGGSLLLHCSRYSPETQALRLCRRGGLHSFRWVIKWASLYCRGLLCLHSQKKWGLRAERKNLPERPVTVYITMRMKFVLWYKLTGRKRQELRDETLLYFRWTNLICDFIHVVWKNEGLRYLRSIGRVILIVDM